MSKTPKTAQVKTKLKAHTETAPKKTVPSETTSKKTISATAAKVATSGLPKAITLAKTTTSTSSTRKTIEDKNKSGQTKQLATPTVVRAKPQASVDKSQGTLLPKSTSKLNTTTNTNLIARNAVPVKKGIVPSKPTEKSQPMRAKHSSAIVEAVKRNVAGVNHQKAPAKPNAVLDTFHNVTVVSPPMRKREIPVEVAEQQKQPVQEQHLSKKLTRTGSRTLEPEEVVVLRHESAKKRLEEQIQAEEGKPHKLPVKEAVAFEVKFEEPPTSKVRERSRSRVKNADKAETVPEDEQANYSDDFDSYESDFETGSSSQNGSHNNETDETSEHESETDATEDESTSEASSAEDSSGKANDSNNAEESEEEESDFTQFPVTVIQRDKERDRKLDSGNYEMNSRKNTRLSDISAPSSQQQCDSLDTLSAATSDQLDSGISNFGNSPLMDLEKHNMAVSYGGYAQFNTQPIINSRGLELMSKIQFDTLTFTLFDMKPTSYDVYMRTYGKLNTAQSGTQTHENRMSRDSQTDDCDMRSIWTQHPAQYDIQTVQKLGNGLNCGYTVQNCCGELSQEEFSSQTQQPQDDFEVSLQAISALQHTENNRSLNQQLKQLRKPLDFERLNAFLLNSALLISKVLSVSNPRRRQSMLVDNSALAVSEGHFKLNIRLLNALRVVRVFANARYNLIISVHESRPDADVYRSDFSNLLMVWSTSDPCKPMRLLSTWSEVCRAEICNDCADIVVCGLCDGSVAMWDLRETYSYCSKLDGSLTHFAATQSIVPSWGSGRDVTKKLRDMGAVVDVKSFRLQPKGHMLPTTMGNYKSIQFTSLNDTGILTVWTLVDTASSQYELPPSARKTKSKHTNSHSTKFEYSSPWARVKLIQSAICDLRDYLINGALKRPTPFEKTRALFQKNIYNDEVLRELGENQTELQQQGAGLQGLRFTSIDTGCERIYVCTNHNFILACSKSLKSERFRKIAIHDSRFLFPTALCVLTNEDFLAVGLSNGSVMILNCNQHNQPAPAEAEDALPAATTEAQQPLLATTASQLETGKSCAIQNIILNERRAPESSVEQAPIYASRPTTAACIALITNQKRPFELRVYDQQLVLSGSALRKHLVQSLALSSDGWRLFALSNGEVRTYDFCLDQEVANGRDGSEFQRAVDIAVARTAASEQHLLVLNAQHDVEVHLLKQ